MLDSICLIRQLSDGFFFGWVASPDIENVSQHDDLGLYCAGGEL